MTDTITVNEEAIDKLIDEASGDIQSTEEIKENLESKKDKEPVKNEGKDMSLDGLGEFKHADPADIEDVYEKLPGTIFQLKSCLFRVCYINKGKNKFTAEIVNLAKD